MHASVSSLSHQWVKQVLAQDKNAFGNKLVTVIAADPRRTAGERCRAMQRIIVRFGKLEKAPSPVSFLYMDLTSSQKRILRADDLHGEFTGTGGHLDGSRKVT